MKYLAAYALVALSGKEPEKKDVEAVLKAGGVTIDKSRLDEVFAQLKGKQLPALIEAGKKKIGSCGAAAAPVNAPTNSAAASAPAAKAPEPEPEDEEEEGGLGGLFD